jgi:hypothetical protein
MTTPLLISRYVDTAVEQLRSWNGLRVAVLPPESMRDETSYRDASGYYGWTPTPSTVTDSQLDVFEKRMGVAFPPLYREFLKYRHFYDLTEAGVCFQTHLPGEWERELRLLIFSSWAPERLIEIGLIPFGSDTNDAGAVCFDTRARLPDGDCPVVVWDHDCYRPSDEITLIFSSSRRMFECLTLVAKSPERFLFNRKRPIPLPKRELLDEFFALDPDGAGGPARGFWE